MLRETLHPKVLSASCQKQCHSLLIKNSRVAKSGSVSQRDDKYPWQGTFCKCNLLGSRIKYVLFQFITKQEYTSSMCMLVCNKNQGIKNLSFSAWPPLKSSQETSSLWHCQTGTGQSDRSFHWCMDWRHVGLTVVYACLTIAIFGQEMAPILPVFTAIK